MSTYRYETHPMPDARLPFIYHRRFTVEREEKHANWHENIELLQAFAGSGFVRCDGVCIPLSAGQLVAVNANTIHSIGAAEQLSYRCLIVDDRFFEENGIPIKTLAFQPLICDSAVYAAFDRVADSYLLQSGGFARVLAIRTEVLRLLQLLCTGYSLPRPADTASHTVKKAMLYLRQHLTEPLTLDTLAATVGVSKFHLARQFKLYTGKTVVQTLNSLRCAEARRRIEAGMSVSAAARECGYESLSYFSRTFQQHYHCLPSQFKKT